MKKCLPSLSSDRWHEISATFFLFSSLALTVGAYWSGLVGPWVLDDAWNLNALYGNAQIDSIGFFLERILAGESGALGRPLALATFVLNDFAMPADPLDFKRTNLCLHLLNGILAYLVFQKIAYLLTNERRDSINIGLAVAALWLIHPLNATTTLYVIQRMTQLMALFALLALLSYVQGRMLLLKGRSTGLLLILFGIGPMAFCSVLAKENGALVPAYILVIEATLFRKFPAYPFYRFVKFLGLYLPLLLVTGYVCFNFKNIYESYSMRNFSLSERLMTQARVVLDYIGRIFIPKAIGAGVIHDDYIISRSFWNPATTIPSIIFLVVMVSISLLWRQKYPIFSFSVLFFMAGHLLESSILPLEIYFEHRNYLPMLSMLFLISWSSYFLLKKIEKGHYYLLIVLAFSAALSVATYTISKTWSNAWKILASDYADHPTSYRAMTNLAEAMYEAGEQEISRQRYLEALNSFPDDIAVKLRIFSIECEIKEAGQNEFEDLLSFMQDGRASIALNTVSEKYLRSITDEDCDFMDPDDIDRLYAALAGAVSDLPHEGVRFNLAWSWARSYLRRGDLNGFMSQADRAFKIDPNFTVLYNQALALYSAGLYPDSLEYAMKAERLLNESILPLTADHRKIELLKTQISAGIDERSPIQ